MEADQTLSRAAVITGYGDSDKLDITKIDRPAAGSTEVLLRVKAASVNPIDWKLRRGEMRFIWPLKFPYVPGFDVAGTVESVGSEVDVWKPGDRVYAALPNGGGHAEYVTIESNFCAAIPEGLSFEDAASVPGGALSALQALRDVGQIETGDHVVVNGASGGVGVFAVQIAVAYGCRVTGVASETNEQLVMSLGADRFVDYSREDVMQCGPCNVFLDVVPNRSFGQCRRALSPTGTYATTLPGPGPLIGKILANAGRVFGFKKKCGWLIVKPNGDDLRMVSKMISGGQVRPVVERVYPLDEIRQANTDNETGHASGKIVLTMD